MVGRLERRYLSTAHLPIPLSCQLKDKRRSDIYTHFALRLTRSLVRKEPLFHLSFFYIIISQKVFKYAPLSLPLENIRSTPLYDSRLFTLPSSVVIQNYYILLISNRVRHVLRACPDRTYYHPKTDTRGSPWKTERRNVLTLSTLVVGRYTTSQEPESHKT